MPIGNKLRDSDSNCCYSADAGGFLYRRDGACVRIVYMYLCRESLGIVEKCRPHRYIHAHYIDPPWLPHRCPVLSPYLLYV